MKPLLPFFVLLTAVACVGCERLTPTCESAQEAPFALNLHKAADRRHLMVDAQTAEDLAIRYADTENKRRFGVQQHGGLLDEGQLRAACMEKLLDAVAVGHRVSLDDVREALTERPEGFDAVVWFSFAVVYSAVSGFVWRRISRRIDDVGPVARGVVLGMSSVVVAGAGLMLGEIWSAVAEVYRVGNGHMTYRALRIPWGQHRMELLIGGVLLFGLIASLQSARSRGDDSLGLTVDSPVASPLGLRSR